MIDLGSLNPPQREAVEHIDGHTLVLAGAGSGKTRVLTYKIAHLVSLGVKPWHILAVTFTNKAAREMAGRAAELLRMPVEHLWIGTFHGICVRILRREAQYWGFPREFSIYDDDDRKGVIKKALADLHISTDRLAPARVKQVIGKAKNEFISPDELGEWVTGPDAELLMNVYRRYDARLREAGAFDFDDLLSVPVTMFRRHPESLDRWRARFDHILVDEYQDTNRTQYLLLRHLTRNGVGVTVVGDDDQSIYKWRGADIGNILGFERDYPGVRTVRLEQNYRSTSIILDTANAVVARNTGRMEKRLWTDRSGGEKVKILECLNDRDEAERVIRLILERRDGDGRRLGEAVVLYRTNSQSRSFEDVLRRKALRYTIVGGVRFYERREIKDVLAYLRLLVNPRDGISFARAAGVPKRGIGDKTIAAVEDAAREHGLTLLEALGRADEFAGGAASRHLKDFAGIMEGLAELRAEGARLDVLAQAVVARIDYARYLEKTEPESFEERLDNVDELITAMGEFENTTEEDDLAAFLAEVSLVADVDTWEDREDVLTLMSMHAAKGLEFHDVYVAGVERGLFPLPKAFDDPTELEEERRLFYVAITRAKDRLAVAYALNRMRYGSFSGGASMFVGEMPAELSEIDAPEPAMSGGAPVARSRIDRPLTFEDYSQEIPEGDGYDRFQVGMFVRHPTFGRGKITARSGAGEKTVLTIMFGSRTKKIVAKYGHLAPA